MFFHLFSPEGVQAHRLVQDWMIQAGMKVKTDTVGNLIGRYHGLKDDAPFKNGILWGNYYGC